MNKWFYRFMFLAMIVSLWSKDRSKVGAVIVRPNKTIASVGFNGLPPGMDDEKHLSNREFKNMCVIHAEENAMIHCPDPRLDGYEMYVFGLHPCGNCAAKIVSMGIKKVYCINCVDSPQWNNSLSVAKQVFDECGVEVNCISLNVMYYYIYSLFLSFFNIFKGE